MNPEIGYLVAGSPASLNSGEGAFTLGRGVGVRVGVRVGVAFGEAASVPVVTPFFVTPVALPGTGVGSATQFAESKTLQQLPLPSFFPGILSPSGVSMVQSLSADPPVFCSPVALGRTSASPTTLAIAN